MSSSDDEIYRLYPPDDFLEVFYGIRFPAEKDDPRPRHEWVAIGVEE